MTKAETKKGGRAGKRGRRTASARSAHIRKRAAEGRRLIASMGGEEVEPGVYVVEFGDLDGAAKETP